MFGFALLALLPLALGVITPTTPDGSTVIKQGDELSTAWTVDTTGNWKSVEIQLMTGDNFNMIPLKTLATGLDGTTTTTFSTPCPEVSPNSKIYFLQFTNGGDPTTATWTTRFTIAGADGSSTPPTNSTNYSGNNVQWGTGALLDDVSFNSTTSSNSTSASASGSASASASSSSAAMTGITVYSTATPSASAAASGSGASQSLSSVSASGSVSRASAAPSASQSKAAAWKVSPQASVVGAIMAAAGALIL